MHGPIDSRCTDSLIHDARIHWFTMHGPIDLRCTDPLIYDARTREHKNKLIVAIRNFEYALKKTEWKICVCFFIRADFYFQSFINILRYQKFCAHKNVEETLVCITRLRRAHNSRHLQLQYQVFTTRRCKLHKANTFSRCVDVAGSGCCRHVSICAAICT
jgi:hypothetical protein